MKKISVNKIIQNSRNKRFLVSTHINPDPDALCSELALAIYLKSLGKKVHIVNAEELPARYAFFPKNHLIETLDSKKDLPYDVAIILDCGELERIDKVTKLIKKERILVNIDHHFTNNFFGDCNIVEPEASSTAEVLFDLFSQLKYPLTKDLAVLLYLGIIADTGCFRYDNTTVHTHEIVAKLMQFGFSASVLYQKLYETILLKDLNLFTKILDKFDVLCEGRVICVDLRKNVLKKFSMSFDVREKIFSFLRGIKGVEVIVIFTEETKKKTRVNLRSVGKFNVAKLALVFGGGGHKKASGCTIKKDMPLAKKELFTQLKKML